MRKNISKHNHYSRFKHQSQYVRWKSVWPIDTTYIRYHDEDRDQTHVFHRYKVNVWSGVGKKRTLVDSNINLNESNYRRRPRFQVNKYITPKVTL